MLITDLDQFKAGIVPAGYPDDRRTFYSPGGDDAHGALKLLLESATQSVILSMYGFDDDELAGIIARHLTNPSMYCQISLDRSQAGGAHEKQIMAKYQAAFESNSVAVGTSERGAINHLKMLIIDGIWVVTGSMNWSTAGETRQANQLTITRSAIEAAEARNRIDLTHSAMLTQMLKRRGGHA